MSARAQLHRPIGALKSEGFVAYHLFMSYILQAEDSLPQRENTKGKS